MIEHKLSNVLLKPADHLKGHDELYAFCSSPLVYDEAAGAVVGAALAYMPHPADKPRIAISMYGITTPCVVHAAKYLEARGYEPIIFHANGAGGKAMKTLIAEGMFQGVLDITTAEVGAYVLDAESSSAGEDRLDAAEARTRAAEEKLDTAQAKLDVVQAKLDTVQAMLDRSGGSGE